MKEIKKGKITIVVSKNYRELYEDNLALLNHLLLDSVKGDNDWIKGVQENNLNITLYTDKNDPELFKKSFDKFEVKLMDTDVNTSPLGKEAIVIKEELVSGWYKYQYTKYLMYHDFENRIKYGFNASEKWVNTIALELTSGYTKADINEVEERLKEEAVKRGFNINSKFKSFDECNYPAILDEFSFDKDRNVFLYSGIQIMREGKWAEIVEEKLTLENIQVDCSDLTTEQIEEMKRVVVENGYKLWDEEYAFEVWEICNHFRFDGTFYIIDKKDDFKTITYDKFMELFDSKIVMDNGSTISNVKEGEVKSIEELHVEHREQSFNEIKKEEFYKALEVKLNPKGLCVEWMEEFNKIPSNVFVNLKFRTPKEQNSIGKSYNKKHLHLEEPVFNPQSHYNNEFGSLYKLSEQLGLNTYEFDILKRVVRCRKKGQFEEDLQKTKDLIDLYLIESKK